MSFSRSALVSAALLSDCYLGQTQHSTYKVVSKNTPAMAKHYGHGTPSISSLEDMNMQSYQIPSLLGHWTLLYYWADWCVPCIQEGIPSLISFAHSHPHDDRLRIVAIRFNSLDEDGDWNSFHTKTLKLEQSMWHGAPPFPIVYDATTHMSADWGIHELPTYALIDPKGNLVKGGDLSVLDASLGKK